MPNNTEAPFGNSMFQITNFTAGQETPERRQRHCSLQLYQKEKALKECEFRRRRTKIDLEEILEELENNKHSYTKFEILRKGVDVEEKEYQLNNDIKMIEDCLFEIRVYRNILKKLPMFTREEFEKSEYKYWEIRLINDAKKEIISTNTISTGTISSLENIGINITRDKDGILTITGKDSAVQLLKQNKVKEIK